MPDYRWRWNSYQNPALIAAFDMSTRTPGGLMKNLVQRTGATYDATINGALTLANPLIKCKKTKCMDFNRALPNWLDLVNPINGLSVYSIAFWMNWNGGFDGAPFSRAGGGSQYIYIYNIGGVVGFENGGVVIRTTGKQSVVGTRTYFIVCTRDSAGTGSIFIDGKFFVRGAIGLVADASAYIGKYGVAGSPFGGRLDNMLFYNVALTPDQINSIYRSANPRM